MPEAIYINWSKEKLHVFGFISSPEVNLLATGHMRDRISGHRWC